MYRTVVLVITVTSIGNFHTEQPPILAVWANKDPFFLVPGAEAFSVTTRTPRCICTTLATLLWKLIIPKSPVPSGIPAGRKLAPQVRAA